ncbi:MAG: murein DD-endopeptidase MepM/ murein hydrolase activator NlpD [Myxococcota bacterium]|jgi:murein DD-endopeptidase MepM/ murein hydrolase activator NlpD
MSFANIGAAHVHHAGAGSAAKTAGNAAKQGASLATTVTVQSGDTLGKLAARHLGSSSQWSSLWHANKDQISNPNVIYPGMKLRLPGGQLAPTPQAPSPHVPAPQTEAPPAQNGAGFAELKKGAGGPEVRAVQARLVALGYMAQTEMNTGPGIFGPRTEGAVRRFQQGESMAATGVVDLATHQRLQTADPRPASEGYLRPVGDVPISSPFGNRLHPISGVWKMHKGTDFAAGYGTDILAVADGTVTVVGWDAGGYGNWVEIEHSDGKRTRYAHMSSVAVGQNASVSQGQSIGKVGSTGGSTGAHLHFEVRVGGQAFDPMGYLP